jgi:hypothetical protein
VNEAQIGLIITTPAIVGVAVALHRYGALSRAGMVAASLVATAIGVIMFLAQ